jgi:NAD(P)-dependent dehydrogenase (short-subunit alcohol dehydrogenase family)
MFDTTKVWLIAGSARGLGRRIAEAVLEAGHRPVATAHDAVPAHLLLGSDAVRLFDAADGARQRDAAAWRSVSLSTDVDTADPAPPLPTATASRGAVDWQAALRS